MANRSKNILGQKFGRLIVLKRVENYTRSSGAQTAQWLCQCECGNLVVIRGDNLRSGCIKSCGCLHRESASNQGKSMKKQNKYDLSGEYGIGYTSNTNEQFFFDLEDYNKIKNYCWCKTNNGYIIAPKSDGDSIFLHRLVMNPQSDEFVDHIFHCKFDNRKSKLRIVNKSQNAMNSITPSNNTSGIKGVSFNKSSKKWIAYIKLNQKNINLGSYVKFEDAVNARKKCRKQIFWMLFL